MTITTRTLSKLLVEMHEDKHVVSKEAQRRRELVAALDLIGVPTTQSNGLAVDVMWTIDVTPSMWDLKTSKDFIASAEDGRLHRQLQAMEERGCVLYGFVLEDEISLDGGVTVGYGTHAWTAERFDNLLLSVQCQGAKVVRSLSPDRTPQRLASLYRWSGKADVASWRKPVAPTYSLTRLYGDKEYRGAVEALMAFFPGCGEERAVRLLAQFSLAEVLGSHPEEAAERWKSVHGVGTKLTAAWEGRLKGDFR